MDGFGAEVVGKGAVRHQRSVWPLRESDPIAFAILELGHVTRLSQVFLPMKYPRTARCRPDEHVLNVCDVEIDERSVMRGLADISFRQSAAGAGAKVVAREERHLVAVQGLPAQSKAEHVFIKGDGTLHIRHWYLEMEDWVVHHVCF